MTLTPIAELLAVELSPPVFYDLGLSRLNALIDCATATAQIHVEN